MRTYLLRHKREVLRLAAIMMVAQLLTVYSAVLNADLLDALIKGKLQLFLIKVGLLMADWLVIAGLDYAISVYQQVVIQNVDISIRADLTDILTAKDYAAYNSRSTGVYESWVNNDIQTINTQGLQNVFIVIEGAMGTVFALITLITYHWSLALAAVFLTGAIILVPKVFDRRVMQANQRVTLQNEAFVNRTQDALGVFNLFYAFQALGLLKKQIIQSSHELKAAYVDRTKAQTNVMVTGFMGNVISQVLLIGLTGWLALQKIVSIGTISAAGSLSGNIFNNLGNMSNYLGMIRGVRPIFEKFAAEKRALTPPRPAVAPATPTSLRVTDLGFAFSGHAPLFEHVTVNFQRGQKYLILGESGSGKSTFLRLLTGYYRRYTGQITLDDTDLTTYPAADLSQKILYLDQRPQALEATVRENLCLGQDFAADELIRVLVATRLVATAADGPAFLDLNVGQNGGELSGGQLQRLALARGLLRHVKLILLDEGTSAVDTANAIRIEKLLLTDPDLTLIMVSHTPHPETQALFDQVIPFADLTAAD